MKVIYTERLENRMAWNRNNFCPSCGAHEYTIVEQLEPKTKNPWYVRCPQCGYESYESPARDIAIARWRQC